MKTLSFRFCVFCLVGILAHGRMVSPAVSQDSKPKEGAKEKFLRAGVDGVGTPVCIHCPSPAYPSAARDDKSDSVSVMLEVAVTEEGKVREVQVISDPGQGFAVEAVDAVKYWKFKPATRKDGTAVAVWVKTEVIFRKSK